MKGTNQTKYPDGCVVKRNYLNTKDDSHWCPAIEFAFEDSVANSEWVKAHCHPCRYFGGKK